MISPKAVFTLFALAIVSISLKGCIAAATVAGAAAGGVAIQTSIRNGAIDAAQAGDPAAQTKVGLSYCCSGPGYSAQKATEWLCKAANQGHARAYYELGRIYTGDTWRIPHPATYISGRVTSKKNLPLGLMWLQLAQDNGITKAKRAINVVKFDYKEAPVLFQKNFDRAAALKNNWRSQPCLYNQVF